MVVSSVGHNGLGNFLINTLEKFSKNWIKYFLNILMAMKKNLEAFTF